MDSDSVLEKVGDIQTRDTPGNGGGGGNGGGPKKCQLDIGPICFDCKSGPTDEEQHTNINEGRIVLPWSSSDHRYYVICIG